MRKIKSLGMIEKNGSRKRYGLFECPICGAEFEARETLIKCNRQKSCGCLNKKGARPKYIKHGLRSHRLYRTWNNMMSRCYNSKCHDYNWYGARGVSVCEDWHSVKNFINDMEPSYEEGLTIDRINVNGDYCKENCRWITHEEQQGNTRTLRSTNSTGYRGVSKSLGKSAFRSRIYHNGREVLIGVFENKIDAAKAYDKYCMDNHINRPINFYGDINNES